MLLFLQVQAVTETIVNACVHRDYLSTGSVQVMLFKDRLEVWNPGRLPKGMTVEKLAGEHASLPVNPLLANPVYLAGYIEQVGTGTNDVIDRCMELGLKKPEFRQDEDFTVVLWRRDASGTIQGDPEVIQSDPVSDPVNDPVNVLPHMAQRVYAIIKDNGGIRRPFIMQKLGVSDSTVKRIVAFLIEKDMIEHRGSAKTGGYYVKK